MALLKLDRFSDERAQPLPPGTREITALRYRLDGELVKVWKGYWYIREEDGQAVMRHTCGLTWPLAATDIEIEYEPAAVVAEAATAPELPVAAELPSPPLPPPLGNPLDGSAEGDDDE